jgi:hypothetical protein
LFFPSTTKQAHRQTFDHWIVQTVDVERVLRPLWRHSGLWRLRESPTIDHRPYLHRCPLKLISTVITTIISARHMDVAQRRRRRTLRHKPLKSLSQGTNCPIHDLPLSSPFPAFAFSSSFFLASFSASAFAILWISSFNPSRFRAISMA